MIWKKQKKTETELVAPVSHLPRIALLFYGILALSAILFVIFLCSERFADFFLLLFNVHYPMNELMNGLIPAMKNSTAITIMISPIIRSITLIPVSPRYFTILVENAKII